MPNSPSSSSVSVYDFGGYKEYLLEALDLLKRLRGETQRSLAKALRCQPAYVSQVLRGDAHFSIEQAEDVNHFLEHSNDEADFFLLLVQHDRAGSSRLKKRIKIQINRAQEERLLLRNRVDIRDTLPLESQLRYYSSWHYAAVHVAISIPMFTTRQALGMGLGIPFQKLNEVLDFLVQTSLIIEDHGSFRQGVSRIFLGSDSPMISKHHSNWRMRAIEAFDRARPEDLHLSTVVSLSSADFDKIREQLVRSTNDARTIIRDSKEETLACLALDFYKLI